MRSAPLERRATSVRHEDFQSRPSAGKRRRGIVIAALLAIGVAVAGIVVAVLPRPAQEPIGLPDDSRTSPPAGWLSGASGDQVGLRDFGAWRGRPVEIAGTWSDNNDAMVGLWELRPDGGFGDWGLPLDVAIGAIGSGESWKAASTGAYDQRWRRSLTNLRDLRKDKAGATYIRFAHEMNGNWYPWSVNKDNHEAFVEAWRRFRGLQQQIFPKSRLVFAVNRESVGTGMDWRDFFPGAEYVDVLAVDYYNQGPAVDSAEGWRDSLDDTDQWGAPKGLQAHLDFARSVGLPLAVPEWSGVASEGDSPAFIRGMYEFFDANGGQGAGQLLYEIQFNQSGGNNNWVLFDRFTRMPKSAALYRTLW